MVGCESTGVRCMRKAALYLRVSALDPTTANHEHELCEIASRMDCEIVKVYHEEDMGGTTEQKRPKLDKLCSDAYNRKFDVVMAWSVDDLAARCTIWLASCPRYMP
jgi:DNA invertase Pin-like site-specific DNA recombinase